MLVQSLEPWLLRLHFVVSITVMICLRVYIIYVLIVARIHLHVLQM